MLGILFVLGSIFSFAMMGSGTFNYLELALACMVCALLCLAGWIVDDFFR